MSEPAGPRLRRLIGDLGLVEAMSAHSPLSAKLALEAGFEAIWAGGFELSALYGLADAGLIGQAEHLEMTRRMVERTGALVVADLDTGYGNAVNLTYAVEAYARAGVAAVVVEDKTFPKMTSLFDGGRQALIRTEEYVGKLRAALAARDNGGPLVVARTEALIAGLGVAEALARSRAYADAGADLLLVHSKAPAPTEIEAFIDAWDRPAPLVVVPTAFPEFGREQARASGKVGMLVHANYALRSAVAAMRETMGRIRAEGSAAGVVDHIASVADLFVLQDMERVSELEARYLR